MDKKELGRKILLIFGSLVILGVITLIVYYYAVVVPALSAESDEGFKEGYNYIPRGRAGRASGYRRNRRYGAAYGGYWGGYYRRPWMPWYWRTYYYPSTWRYIAYPSTSAYNLYGSPGLQTYYL